MDAAAVQPGIDLGMAVCQRANQREEIGSGVEWRLITMVTAGSNDQQVFG